MYVGWKHIAHMQNNILKGYMRTRTLLKFDKPFLEQAWVWKMKSWPFNKN